MFLPAFFRKFKPISSWFFGAFQLFKSLIFICFFTLFSNVILGQKIFIFLKEKRADFSLIFQLFFLIFSAIFTYETRLFCDVISDVFRGVFLRLFLGCFLTFFSLYLSAKSLITSPAIISPIADGTKEILPGTRRLSPSLTSGVITGSSLE